MRRTEINENMVRQIIPEQINAFLPDDIKDMIHVFNSVEFNEEIAKILLSAIIKVERSFLMGDIQGIVLSTFFNAVFQTRCINDDIIRKISDSIFDKASRLETLQSYYKESIIREIKKIKERITELFPSLSNELEELTDSEG